MFRIMLICLLILCTASAFALERKDIRAVSPDELTPEVQKVVTGDNSQVNLVWWLPTEFWGATLSNDPTTTEEQKTSILTTLRPYMIIGATSAEVSQYGAFTFHDKETVAANLSITYVTEDGTRIEMVPQEGLNSDLDMMLAMLTPVLAGALGNFGNNMHFFTCRNFLDDGSPVVDPYERGNLELSIKQADGTVQTATIEMPLNALYVPRKCPNGKDAHVSWNYCPWSGEKLPE